jgi:hypothetical protein
MKISDLIKTLQSRLDEDGDIPIQFCSDEGGWIGNLIDSNPNIYTRARSDYEDSDGENEDNQPVGDVSVLDFFDDNDKILQFGFDIRIY